MLKKIRALLIFIKNPIPGKVKTRLAADVGTDRALSIYLSLLAHTREQSAGLRADRLLFYSDHIDQQDEWPEKLFEKKIQEGDDLGERMSRAFQQAFERADSAVIIGSDCPGLTTSLLERAFEALETHDFVIGPALDGGYYLLGMRSYQAAVFAGIQWSTDEVFPQTMLRIGELNASCAQLPALSDVDYLEDWEKWESAMSQRQAKREQK